MATKQATPAPYRQPYRYKSPDIPLSAIRRFARQIAEKFHPEKIILFGSYAYGIPHSESDVDLLVIMPAYDVVNQAIRICLAFDRPFSFDLLVRTPKQIKRGIREDDDFLIEITGKGKVLYQQNKKRAGTVLRRAHGAIPMSAPVPLILELAMKRQTAQWIRKAEEDWQAACELSTRKPPLRDAACFHCQQSAEKYLKGLIKEMGGTVHKTHDLEDVLDILLPSDSTLAPVRRSAASLSKYAVEYRYPGVRANQQRMEAALRNAGRIRTEIRTRLGLEL